MEIIENNELAKIKVISFCWPDVSQVQLTFNDEETAGQVAYWYKKKCVEGRFGQKNGGVNQNGATLTVWGPDKEKLLKIMGLPRQ